jgi:hypothetical protein
MKRIETDIIWFFTGTFLTRWCNHNYNYNVNEREVPFSVIDFFIHTHKKQLLLSQQTRLLFKL